MMAIYISIHLLLLVFLGHGQPFNKMVRLGGETYEQKREVVRASKEKSTVALKPKQTWECFIDQEWLGCAMQN